jgi:hypothetical protein
MSPAKLIDDLMRRGVRFRIEGDRLVPRGPRHVLTPALDTLRSHKAEVMAELLRRANCQPSDLPLGLLDDLRDYHAVRVAICTADGIPEDDAQATADAGIAKRIARHYSTMVH